MKHTGLTFIFILLLSNCLFAQDAGYYTIRIQTLWVANAGNDACQAGFQNAINGYIFQRDDIGSFSEGARKNYTSYGEQRYLAENKPLYIDFHGYRGWYTGVWPFRNCGKQYNEPTQYYIGDKYPYWSHLLTDGVYDGLSSNIDILIKPDTISLFYFDTHGNASGDNHLPTDDNITLKATTGFPNEVYPSLFYTISNPYRTGITTLGSPERTFKGLDFLSMEELDEIIKNQGTIQFNVNYPNANKCNVITLTPMLSAPKILSVSTDSVVCFGERNGKIKIKFDRVLRTGERLYISLSGNEFRESEVTTMNIDNEVTLDGLFAGDYNIGLLGTYAVNIGTVNTYTAGLNHTATATVYNRPALSLSVSSNAVHCNGGMDGAVNFTVAGGNGNFTAFLIDPSLAAPADTLRRMSVTAGNHSFTDLYKGNYQVYVKDTNGCDRDIDGIQTRTNIEITEPPEAVRISVTDNVEAHGYGLSTGWAQVTVDGGTPGGYAFTWQRREPLTNMPATETTATTSKLANLPSDWYIATVKDINFIDAIPPTEINTKGCTDSVHIFIEQPPKLLVEIEETKIVTCHADNVGELTAHAKGGRPFNPAQDAGRTLPYNYEWFKIENGVDNAIGTNDSILSNLYTGYYKVKVTDRNSIEAISTTFHLIEPDELIATTVVLKHVLCEGDNTGEAEVTVTGGTPPYTYQWTTDNNDTTAFVENLRLDRYTVFVKDSRYQSETLHKRCTVTAYVDIQSPDGIVAEANVINPTCHQYADGKITLTVSGGTPPYRYLWENGSTGKDRSNLPQGEYSVTITDANDCSIGKSYTLTEPAPVVVDLGNDFTLCAAQQLTVRDAIAHGNVFYQWTNQSGSVLSAEPELTVSAAGTYKLIVSTPEGCTGEDEITVNQSEDVLHTDFVVASLIPRGKVIHAVNIIKTDVDRVEWILPDEAIVAEETAQRVGMSFAQTGEYSIGLIGYLGQCSDIMYKTVKVLEPGEIEDYADTEPFLKRFIVYPNPNDGNFTVEVELREPADYQLLLFNENGLLLESKEIQNREWEETQFSNNSLGAGTYFLRFVSKEYASIFKVIIK